MAETYLDGGYLNNPTPAIPGFGDISPADYTVEEVFKETAVLSKEIFVSQMSLVMPRPGPFGQSWAKGDVLNLLDLCLKDVGFKQTAKFMLLFGREAAKGIIISP